MGVEIGILVEWSGMGGGEGGKGKGGGKQRKRNGINDGKKKFLKVTMIS